MGTHHVGERIRELRKVRQLTVRQLASRVTISISLLEKIEAGYRTPSPGLVTQLARALSVGVERITGQPYIGGAAETEEQVQAVIPDLRRVLLTYDTPDDLLTRPRPLPVLAAEVAHIAQMRQDGQYVAMGPLLPGLLSELTHTALAAPPGQTRERAYWLLATGYRVTNSLAHKLGYHDLSFMAVERVHWAAGRSGDPLMQVLGAFLRAGAMIRAGALGSARRTLEALEQEIERLAPEASLSAQQLAFQGAVLLKLAIVEARDQRPDAAAQRLDEARVAAGFLGVDSPHYDMNFGPTNVGIYQVAALIDIGDTDQALGRLREWGAEQGRTEWELPAGIAAERASHHHIDVAAARLAEGDRQGAFADLMVARGVSPVHTRFHPTVRHTAAALVRLDRQHDDAVAGFARWVGV